MLPRATRLFDDQFDDLPNAKCCLWSERREEGRVGSLTPRVLRLLSKSVYGARNDDVGRRSGITLAQEHITCGCPLVAHRAAELKMCRLTKAAGEDVRPALQDAQVLVTSKVCLLLWRVQYGSGMRGLRGVSPRGE